MSGLNKAQKTALNRASQAAVTRSAGELLRQYLPNDEWIGPRNRYRIEILDRLEADLKAKTPDSKQLSQYLAASALHHCADGWSYFGRALTAHLAGDAETARHLGYYAELRAAIAALATHGIGIYNYVLVVIQSGPNARLVKGRGTHVMTWLSLPHWAQTQAATASVAGIVSPHGVPLDVWATALPGAGAWRPVAEEWLRTWGLDLAALALDRDSRNESSYQPSRITGKRSIDADRAAEFAIDAWALLEPAGPSDPFSVLDLQLLRRGLEAVFRSVGGTVSAAARSPWATAIGAAIEDAVGDPQPPGLRDFLLRRESATRDDSPLFAHADARRAFGDPLHHLGVLSRALLLLRISSGCIERMCSTAGVSADDLSFWMEGLSEDRGLWPARPLPDPLTGLYDDVEPGVQDIKRLLAGSPRVNSYHDLRTRGQTALLALGGCERVALWSTAP